MPGKERRTYTEEEREQYAMEGATRGRKGCKMVRINMAFTPDVHEYIRVMSRLRGESITEFTAHVFRRYMAENAEAFARAKAFRDET